MRTNFPVGLLMIATLAACARTPVAPNLNHSQTREAWNAQNDPARLKDAYEVRLDALPLSGDLEAKPWTDTYWPNDQGGLADRWHHPEAPDAFTYALNDAAAVAAMDETALSHLSPAEKYDIFRGDYDYPFVKYERQRTSPDHPFWFGLCHGWAPAAMNFMEPKPVVVESAAGLKVPFGSSDVKALLTFAQQYGTDSRIAGTRCEGNGSNGNACQDINAGSFHIILTNQIGLLKVGFVAEISLPSQIWNQPVFGFASEKRGETDVVYPEAAPGTVKIVQVVTTLRYIDEKGPNWDVVPFSAEIEGNRTYEYTLELNAAGEILGGEWVGDDHPDFVWTQSAPELTGFFADLAKIYEASIL